MFQPAHSRRTVRTSTALLVLSAVAALAGCSAPPSENESTNAGDSDFLPCIVSDSGGFNDRSFNQLGLEGVQKAADSLGTQLIQVESKTESDFGPNLSNLVNQGCSVIVAMSFNLADAVRDAAAANPDVHFVLVDDDSVQADNVKSIVWDTSQPAFLVGYAAASYSKSGKVGTYGGMQIPPVTLYMDGFARGVEYYNEQNGTDVQVVGWNPDSQEGQFVGNFTDINAAKVVAQGILDQGADVIVPVGGPIYKGAGQAIREGGDQAALVGVDADMYVSDPDYDDIWFTSIARDMPGSIAEVVQSVASGDWSADPYVGTLDNSGVLMAPFHDFESKVAPDLQSKLDAISTGIIDGSITIDTPAAYK